MDNSWALAYTGGKAGPADSTQTPFVIGYVNDEGGTLAYPEATQGIEAGVKYLNAELGGIGGRPIQLEKCLIQTEEDGQKCGTQLVNDAKVQFVITGTLAIGAKSLYAVLSGKKPTIVGNPVVNEDFLTPDTYAFTPGSPGVLQGMAVFTAKNLPNVKKVAVIYANNPAGTIGFTLLTKPPLAKLGITDVTGVPISDTATASDVATALQAAGADKADVLIPLTSVQQCISTYDALQSLGIKPTVVTTGLCFGTPMTKHLQDLGSKDVVPDGWYFGGYGYSYFVPDAASGMATYVAKVHQYGPPDVEYTGFAGPDFADLMTAVQLVNKIGVANVTPDTMRQALLGFAGPMMIVVGPMKCGANPTFKSLCGTHMNIQQYKSGQWIQTAPDIDPVSVLAAA